MGRLRAEGTYLFHICDGKVTRLVAYFASWLAFPGLPPITRRSS